MRIAIFGGGSIGTRHATNARQMLHDVDVYDSDPSRGQAIWQFTGADAVLICTPASTHEAVAADLSRLGYAGAIFVEKPIALSSAAPIFREWPHPVTMVGYNWRFHPEIAPLQELAQRGGTLHLRCRTNMRTWPGRDYGDPFLETSHEVDLACHWLGEPTTVLGGRFGDDGAWVQMQHPSGDSVVDVLWNSERARRDVSIYLPGHLTCVHAGIDLPHEPPALTDSYILELEHFLDCVREGRPTLTPFADGLRVVEICERVKELAVCPS